MKRLAAAWALAAGYDALADEVRLPHSPFRADLVAARTRGCSASEPAAEPFIALFECKQARADLLKDAAAEMATRARLAELHARRVALEELIAVHRPDLRVGETLFPEFDRLDFSDLRHEGYHAVMAEIARLKTRRYARTKFTKLARWCVAHACYLVVEPEICTASEVPEGWGLLVRAGETLELSRRPAQFACRDPWGAVAVLARAGQRRLVRDWNLRAESLPGDRAPPA